MKKLLFLLAIALAVSCSITKTVNDCARSKDGKLEYSTFAGGYFNADKGELTRDELQSLLK